MAGSFDMIREVSPVKDCWRLRVRGGKIQASIRKPMMKKFKNAIMEGEVYTMINFGVIRSAGNYRASKLNMEYKLLFSGKTRVFQAQSELIPLNGLSLVNTDDVAKTNGDSNYLIGLVGLLTTVSGEKELITGGKKTRIIQLELTEEKGKVQCTVFGDYVDIVKEFLVGGVSPLPVLVVQFFKVRLYNCKRMRTLGY
ncbi:Nucleic acid-binding, OB-fold [Sesbania bispinosa]|nr:Nucleic acid-binding, OB-fold [Sesbania bispinosa]